MFSCLHGTIKGKKAAAFTLIKHNSEKQEKMIQKLFQIGFVMGKESNALLSWIRCWNRNVNTCTLILHSAQRSICSHFHTDAPPPGESEHLASWLEKGLERCKGRWNPTSRILQETLKCMYNCPEKLTLMRPTQ